MKEKDLRLLAYRAIRRSLGRREDPKAIIESMYFAHRLTHSERAFLAELVYGTLRWMGKIDWIIDSFLEKPHKLDLRVRNALRLGIYQMDHMNSVPDYAAVHETVELVKKLFKREPYLVDTMARLTNAVLRRYQREREKIKFPKLEEDPVKHISVVQSHPEWMVRRWVERFGVEGALKLCEANNRIPPLVLRANTLRCTREQLIEDLEREGVKAKPGRYAPEAVVLEDFPVFERLSSFKKGWFFVQDEASMLVVHVLSPDVDELIVDVCAAPGGKTTHIGQMAQNLAKIVAIDLSKEKLKLVRENCVRLGIMDVQLREHDATEPIKELIGRADRVLVDAPCSNTGVIRRHPDLKWNKSEEEIGRFAELQLKLLIASSQYVRRGGVLVYSTCSLEPEENEDVIEKFLGEVKGFEVEDVTRFLPPPAREMVTPEGFFKSYPHLHEIDGFFCARLRRRG